MCFKIPDAEHGLSSGNPELMEHQVLHWSSAEEALRVPQNTYLILLGSMRSMSLSFFQKSCGGGEASTLHSNRTVSPSSARELDIFWTKVGGRRTSWTAGGKEEVARELRRSNRLPTVHCAI